MASKASVQQVMVFFSNLNTNQANLASGTPGWKEIDLLMSLNTNQANRASETSVQQLMVFSSHLNSNR